MATVIADNADPTQFLWFCFSTCVHTHTRSLTRCYSFSLNCFHRPPRFNPLVLFL